jgi:predicted nucleic acid-binding protein
VARIFIFDSDPAGLVCHDPGSPERGGVWNWMFKEWIAGAIIVVPAIVDYEVRRSLILAGTLEGVERLDALYEDKQVRYLPITQAAMKKAAELWAKARREHRPTVGDQALDGDVILSAQAMEFCSHEDDWQVITENVDHIARYVGGRARSRRAVVDEWLKSSKGSI